MRQRVRLGTVLIVVLVIGSLTSAGTSAPSNIINGTMGDDVLTATAAADVIYAKTGDDRIVGVGTGDVVYAGSGNDEVDIAAGSTGISIDANVGNDEVSGAADGAVINLGSGHDRLTLDGCGNRVFGGSGADEYRNSALCAGSAGRFDLGNGDDEAVVAHVEAAVLGNGHDTLTTQFPGVVNAGSGNDLVRFAGGGDSSVYLMAGNDRLRLDGAIGVVAFGNSGQDHVWGSYDESVINTESGEDLIELYSLSTNNHLNGGANHDVARLSGGSTGTICSRVERITDLDGNQSACS